MKKYELLGGGFIEADTPRDIVEQLNEQSKFGRRESLEEYMQETSEACRLQNGAIIRTKNFILFVEDLKKNGFLKEV